jgi:hypothetical protein
MKLADPNLKSYHDNGFDFYLDNSSFLGSQNLKVQGSYYPKKRQHYYVNVFVNG